MKKVFLFLFLLQINLLGALSDKSAIVYYGEEISYPLAGIHDYIIVQAGHIKTATHGFSLYGEKMYAYVSIGEIDKNSDAYIHLDSTWVVAQNKAWKSDVLDINNKEYQEFIFEKQIEPKVKQGFKNFFFDTLDSYYFYAKTSQEIKQAQNSLSSFIHEFKKRYPDAKLIINRGFGIIDKVRQIVDAVLFESYYHGLSGEKLEYSQPSESDREWLDLHLNKIKSYGIDIIALDYLQAAQDASTLVKKLQKKGFIPYVANKELNIYGQSSKNAIKREVLTLVYAPESDESNLVTHRYGGLVLEYLGYRQQLHRIDAKALPDISQLHQYAGLVIWLQEYYKEPKKLIKWLNQAKKTGIKIVFVGNFGFDLKDDELKEFGITIKRNIKQRKLTITTKHPDIGFEIEPSMAFSDMSIEIDSATPLLKYLLEGNTSSTPAALTAWGGYIVNEAYIASINDEVLWIANPFSFFPKALGLKTLPVPDPTTENGKRLLFTHIDGDGIMNRVEGDFGTFSGDVILNHILKKYPIPHSVSVIGAEIEPSGLYPQLSKEMIQITKDMFALEHVEGASHTFTHPFIWGKIEEGRLDEAYRLKVKDYNFSLQKELDGQLDKINQEYFPATKKQRANTVFWSGDCLPREDTLAYLYKNSMLAINGGDTTIVKTSPWISRISPFGIRRGEYYQVFAGAQNENVFTNDWLGPFWGFKRVIQTFELTNSPRRLKPIDIYYHLYSGSKQASLEALKYVFDWAMREDTMPIFTSEYIPKVLDMYEVSMAQEKESWLIEGLKNLKTIRLENFDGFIDLESSKGVAGFYRFENHTYISGTNASTLLLTTSKTKPLTQRGYMTQANARLQEYKKEGKKQYFTFEGHVDLKLSFHLEPSCKLSANPQKYHSTQAKEETTLLFKNTKTATVELECF